MYTYLSDLKKPLQEQLEAGIANQRSRFPTSMGLASEALNLRRMLHSNRVEMEHQFNDDVDNVLKVKPLRHMINA